MKRKVVLGLVALLAAGTAFGDGSAGSLDTGFGDGGVVVTPAYGFTPDVACQSGGKLVVAGEDALQGNAGVVRRYLADGTLDSAFGVVTLAISVKDVAIDSQDRILLGGSGTLTSGKGKKVTTRTVAALARLLANGTLDGSFGSGGTVLTDVIGTELGEFRSVAIRADGRILAAGIASVVTTVPKVGPFHHGTGLLACYRANGGLDSGFGSGGIVLDDPGTTESDAFRAVACQADGKAIVLWSDGIHPEQLRRYTVSGTLDSSFGAAGVVAAAASDAYYGIAVDSADRIVAVGTRSNDGLAVRYLANGAVDTSFADAGSFVTLTLPPREYLLDVAHGADGKVVLAGAGGEPVSGSNQRYVITYRLNEDGTPDETYGAGGIGEVLSLGNVRVLGDMAIDGNGNVAVSFGSGSRGDWALARWCGN